MMPHIYGNALLNYVGRYNMFRVIIILTPEDKIFPFLVEGIKESYQREPGSLDLHDIAFDNITEESPTRIILTVNKLSSLIELFDYAFSGTISSRITRPQLNVLVNTTCKEIEYIVNTRIKEYGGHVSS
jgi:hypothetical protein